MSGRLKGRATGAARRRHPATRYAVLVLALVLMGGVYTLIASTPGQAEAGAQEAASRLADDVKEGEKLYQANCMSCHGTDLRGTDDGPSLQDVGGAAVDFQVSTGRMPSSDPEAQMKRKQPRFDETQIRQLVAYVQAKAGGPSVAEAEAASRGEGDAAKGGRLFRANCIQCHNFVGEGGALTQGRSAPDLRSSTELQIYEAMITGPGAMPIFTDGSVSPQDKRDIIAYVVESRNTVDPGGFNLGRFGPVTEGIVGWIVGVGLMVLAAMWITAKTRRGNG